MKKIFAGIVLPTLAAVAVIGSGFSVWFFGENQDKVSTNGSIKVENLLRIGDLTTSTTSADLHLDQTAAVRSAILDADNGYVSATTNGNVDKKSNYDSTSYGTYGNKSIAKGIYLTSNVESFDIKYTTPFVNKNVNNNQFHDYIDGVAKLQIVTTFKFEGGAKKFVGMNTTTTNKGTWDTTNKDGGIYTFTWKTETTGDNTYTMTLPLNNSDDAATAASDFTFVYLEYTNQYEDEIVDGKRDGTVEALKTAEPHTDQEYESMLASVGSTSKLTIETVATIVKA